MPSEAPVHKSEARAWLIAGLDGGMLYLTPSYALAPRFSLSPYPISWSTIDCLMFAGLAGSGYVAILYSLHNRYCEAQDSLLHG